MSTIDAAAKTKKIDKLKNKFTEVKSKNNFFTRNFFVILAFVIPFLFIFIALAIKGVSPFGKNQILVTDLWHQYYPFLVDFQNKLQTGGSLLWTWTVGAGTNFVALISYYLASPLNFLSVLVPSSWLREFLYVITCVKIGCAGGFFAIFLKVTFKKNDISITVFSILYALCSFIMGYYWCVIWLDTVALLPLVVCGAISLLKDGKFRLYVISLALSILANYYIGLFTCVFVVLVAIGYLIINDWKDVKKNIINTLKLAGCSLLGGAMSAILTLPAYLALTRAHSAASTFPASFSINIGSSATFLGVLEGFGKTLANSIAFIPPSTKEGLPNVYCGIIALVLGFLFFTCKGIKIREKIFCGALELFFIYSFIDRRLDYMWHGFHFPNMLPYRFSFLFSFVLVYMAFRAYQHLDGIKLKKVLIATVLYLALLALCFQYDEKLALIGSAFIGILIIVWLILYSLKIVPKQALSLALLIVCLAEGACTAYIGAKTVSVTDATNYPLSYKDVMQCMNEINNEEQNNEDLFHEELTKYHALDDVALYNMRGISQFNSVVTESVSKYMEKLGICSWPGSNRYTYADSSPYTDLLLNIKYKIATNSNFVDTKHNSLFTQSSSVKALVNDYYVNQGFIVNDDLLNFKVDSASDNPFVNQNEMFNLSTGIDGELYEALEVLSQGHTDYKKFPVNKNSYGNYSFTKNEDCDETPHLKYNYEIPRDGSCYIYFRADGADNCTIKINNIDLTSYYCKRPFIMNAGDVKEGDMISVYADIKDKKNGTVNVYCCMLNDDLFEQGYEYYQSQTMTTSEHTDTSITGSIDVTQDNALLYTSIAYDPGWKAYIDGKEVPITSIDKGLIALKIDKGNHFVKLKYIPDGFIPALIITIASILVFACLCLIYYKNKKKKLSTETIEENNDEEEQTESEECENITDKDAANIDSQEEKEKTTIIDE